MRYFLGVDGGGSKTEFVLLRADGTVASTHREGPAYYLETGIEALGAMLVRGIGATLAAAGVPAGAVEHAFLGLPAHGEDSALVPTLDALAAAILPRERYHCGNDMVCGWAGALACQDGINIVAGTGSIAYGEFGGRQARAGGWGELFSDEGSAYWTAREGLALFSRMSDGRAPRGALHALLREHFGLTGQRSDLDICAAVYGPAGALRSNLAQLAAVVARAAEAGDAAAAAIFTRGGGELAQIVRATRAALQVPAGTCVRVSYSGGMFQPGSRLLEPLRAALDDSGEAYRLAAPLLGPGAGAALYAARCAGVALEAGAVERLLATAR